MLSGPTLTRVDDRNPAQFAPILSRLSSKHKNSTFVFHNPTNKMVAAYVFKWTAVGGSDPGVSYQGFDGMAGIGGTDKDPPSYGVEPKRARIISPAINIHERSVDTAVLGEGLAHATKGNRIAQAMDNGTTYTPTLDMVIYEDGTVSEPDAMGFADRMIADRNARHDVGAEVLRAMKAGKTEAEVEDLLRADVATARTIKTDKGHDLYLVSRGRYADQILMMKARFGQHGVMANANEFARMHQVKLKRNP